MKIVLGKLCVSKRFLYVRQYWYKVLLMENVRNYLPTYKSNIYLGVVL